MQSQPICEEVFLKKYAKDGETTRDAVYRRVAAGVVQAEKPELRETYAELFYLNMKGGAIGAGRIMSAAGTGIAATLNNCFVQPVGDSIQGIDARNKPGIYDAVRMAAETMRRGGGVGYNFSRIRPNGALVKGTHSSASGPCSYMDLFDTSCRTVESAGARRGAQMGILNIDHPDLLAFIAAKREKGRWNNFNVSVGVTSGFMEVMEADGWWDLVHEAEPGKDQIAAGATRRDDGMWVYRTVKAREIWQAIMQATYDYAEPGVVFLDNMNRDNNLRYCEVIEATNPCVTADTWVTTAEGPMQVSDLIGIPFTAIVNGTEFASGDQGFFVTGTKPVFRLTTKEGYALRLTEDHLVRRVKKASRYR